jgi:hypothetical protein
MSEKISGYYTSMSTKIAVLEMNQNHILNEIKLINQRLNKVEEQKLLRFFNKKIRLMNKEIKSLKRKK